MQVLGSELCRKVKPPAEKTFCLDSPVVLASMFFGATVFFVKVVTSTSASQTCTPMANASTKAWTNRI